MCERLPMVMIVGGMPGTGKTTLARKLAPALDTTDFSAVDANGWVARLQSIKTGALTIQI